MIPIVVYTPDAEAKREATARTQAGPRPLPEPTAYPTREDLRPRLRTMRQEARSRQPELVAILKATLDRCGVPHFEATDAPAALRHISALAGETRCVAINKSGVVYNELRPGLIEAGYQVMDTYFDEFAEAPRAPRHHWALPPLESSRVEISFAGRPVEPLRSTSTRPVVGLLGVSAVAAEDGAVFCVEHFSNISQILRECQTLILVVALDKIVPDRAAAALQAQGMALFGLDSLLLDLRPRPDKTPHVLGEVPLTPAPGPPSLHVLLLDNGRRALAAGTQAQLLDCIGCRACLRQCPTYDYFGGPNRRNPKEYLAYALAGEPNPRQSRSLRPSKGGANFPLPLGEGQGEGWSGRALPGKEDRGEPLSLCTSCGMCREECPVDIEIPFMIAEQRAQGPLTWQRWALARAELGSRMASWTAPVSNWALQQRGIRLLLEKTLGIHRDRTLPTFARDSLPRWFRRHSPLTLRQAQGERGAQQGRPEVAYFAGCSANYSTPEIGRALVAILERNGIRVTYPRQRCSGMPAFANGDFALVRRNAEHNLPSLQAAVERGADIVTTCTSCSLMLKKYYPQLLGERARPVSERVFNSEEYLLALHRQGKLDARLRPLPARVSYHVPCHLKDQRQDLMSVHLLNLIPGVQATVMPGGCSGMCGTFGMKKQYYDISMEIGAHLFAEIERPDVDIPATDCPTCKLQMDHGSSKTTQHPLLLLAKAYGLEGT